MMNAKNAAWIAVAFVLCMAIVAMLRSCVFVRAITSQARLQRLLASLPELENVALLDEVAGVSSGADDKCYTVHVHRLYGSDQSAEDVLGFFRDTLLSGGVWEEIKQRPVSRRLTLQDRKQGFRLSIDYNIRSYGMSGFTSFSEHSIAKAQQQFAMPFVTVLDHADKATREKCWPGWEPQ